MNHFDTYDYFVDVIWPEVIERLSLAPDTEPDDEAYEAWLGIEIDEDFYDEQST